MPGPRPLAVDLREVAPITWGGGEAARFLLRGSDTGGLFSFYQVRVPAGEGSLQHRHEAADETFYVVDGEFEITVDDVVHRAGPGVLVYGPRGLWHQFRNVAPQVSTMLCVMTPGGVETFFEELSDLVTRVPPPPWESLRELAGRHGIVARPPAPAHFTERTVR
jgi:mannose-6-phosphate isomerase-like protein (cupin superfamily)